MTAKAQPRVKMMEDSSQGVRLIAKPVIGSGGIGLDTTLPRIHHVVQQAKAPSSLLGPATAAADGPTPPPTIDG